MFAIPITGGKGKVIGNLLCGRKRNRDSRGEKKKKAFSSTKYRRERGMRIATCEEREKKSSFRANPREVRQEGSTTSRQGMENN